MMANAVLPHFDVELTPPDLTRWLPGNTGVPGFWTIDSGRPGPHVGLIALMHGNELAGAIALTELLDHPIPLACGRLTLGFANLAAFERFDPAQPTASRFVDEDLNRLWDIATLESGRRSKELDRARAMRPLVDTFDVVMDLHSMLWPSDPLILSGLAPRGQALACAIGWPPAVVSDVGHSSGKRLIDYPAFLGDGHATGVLVEAGQHWQRQTVHSTRRSIDNLLHVCGLAPQPGLTITPGHLLRVTVAITAGTNTFSFVRAFRGGEVIAQRNTLIALDGTAEIRTPYDDCMLVMPSLRPSRGHTAVRLAQFAS